MISLPILPAATAEKSAKSAAPAGIDGRFASMLDGETGNATQAGGKILPEGGKDLPDGLPVETLTKQVAAKALGQVHTKFELKAQPNTESEADETADAAVETDDGDISTATDTPTATADGQVVAAIVLAVQMPAKLDPAPRAETKPDAETAEQAPAAVGKGKQDRRERSGEEASAQPRERIEGARIFRSPRAEAAIAALTAQTAGARAEKTAPAEAAPAAEQTAATETGATAAVLAQDAARPVKQARPQARHEVTLELVKDAKAVAADQGPSRASAATVLDLAQAAQPIASDAAAPADPGAKPTLAAAPQAVRPHEFTALIDRLVEAREAARPANANLTVMHADFGQVSVSFGQDNGNLTVSLASNDPGFIPAVNAATAADGAGNGDASFQGRRDEGGQAARGGNDTANTSSGQGGNGRDGAGRNFRNDPIRQQPAFAAATRRSSPGGIFA